MVVISTPILVFERWLIPLIVSRSGAVAMLMTTMVLVRAHWRMVSRIWVMHSHTKGRWRSMSSKMLTRRLMLHRVVPHTRRSLVPTNSTIWHTRSIVLMRRLHALVGVEVGRMTSVLSQMTRLLGLLLTTNFMIRCHLLIFFESERCS